MFCFLQEESTDDGDRAAAPGQILLDAMRQFRCSENMILIVAMIVPFGQPRFSTANRQELYKVCAQDVLNKYGSVSLPVLAVVFVLINVWAFIMRIQLLHNVV